MIRFPKSVTINTIDPIAIFGFQIFRKNSNLKPINQIKPDHSSDLTS